MQCKIFINLTDVIKAEFPQSWHIKNLRSKRVLINPNQQEDISRETTGVIFYLKYYCITNNKG